jgi:hypothetical protein
MGPHFPKVAKVEPVAVAWMLNIKNIKI